MHHPYCIHPNSNIDRTNINSTQVPNNHLPIDQVVDMPGITNLPNEILDAILDEVVEINQREGVSFTFGLSQLPPCNDQTVSTRVERSVRGPTPPYQARWDATTNLRQVCTAWHDWSLNYALRDVYVKMWRGSERWADLSLQRGELIYSQCTWFA